MPTQTAMEEYNAALRQGLKEKAELEAAGKKANPAVLDELVPDVAAEMTRDLGLMEIPRSGLSAPNPPDGSLLLPPISVPCWKPILNLLPSG